MARLSHLLSTTVTRRCLVRCSSESWRGQPRQFTATLHEGHPREPNGFLFNEKPLLPGERREKEGWERPWVYGMGTSFLILFIVAVFKPDTTVRGWARERALERVECWEAARSK